MIKKINKKEDNKSFQDVLKFLKKEGANARVTGWGVSRSSFIKPSILFHHRLRPEKQYKYQDKISSKYLKTVGKKKIKELANKEIFDRFDMLEKSGETKEFLRWRKRNNLLERKILKLANRFNKSNNFKGVKALGLSRFTDGGFYLGLGEQLPSETFDRFWTKMQKLPIKKKKQMLLRELETFASFGDFLRKY